MSWTRKILLILGFLSTLAVIALIAVAVTQNKPLPKNIKVLQAGTLTGKQAKLGGLGVHSAPGHVAALLGLANLSFWVCAPQHLILHLHSKNRYGFTWDHLLSNQSQFCCFSALVSFDGNFALKHY